MGRSSFACACPAQDIASAANQGPVMSYKHHGATNCQRACCPTMPVPVNDSLLKLNAHCEYNGHCVQLKHTFIHVECSLSSDEEDNCAICTVRRRSRSSDNIELSLERPA